MNLTFVLTVCAILTIFLFIKPNHADCGCNKAKRNSVPKSTQSLPNSEAATVDKEEFCKKPNNENTEFCADKTFDKFDKDTTFKQLLKEENYESKRSFDSTYTDMIRIPGGMVTIGTDKAIFPDDKESPQRTIEINDFFMDLYEVSNTKFQEFVDDTGYKTEAETFGDSFLFKQQINKKMQDKYHEFRVVNAPWWYKIDDVSWQKPEGKKSNLNGRWDHPVVHVSWRDAVRYCRWANKRLPTEAEWETACRGGKKNKLFPWGNKLMPNDQHRMNIWQGDDFPENNLAEDGYESTCAVTKFNQNSYNMHNIVGNVWEWTADSWDPIPPNEDTVAAAGAGAATGDSSEVINESTNVQRVKKGGSFLCHKSYCYRYRCAARSQNTADSSASNLGFRCAKNI